MGREDRMKAAAEGLIEVFDRNGLSEDAEAIMAVIGATAAVFAMAGGDAPRAMRVFNNVAEDIISGEGLLPEGNAS